MRSECYEYQFQFPIHTCPQGSALGINMRKKSASLVVGGVVAAQLVLGLSVAPAAQAAVWGCTTGYSSTGPYGYCSSGDSSRFKANINCRNVFTKIFTKQISGPSRVVGGGSPSVIPGCGFGQEYTGSIWMSPA